MKLVAPQKPRHVDHRRLCLLSLVRLALLACCIGAVISPIDFSSACAIAAYLFVLFILTF